MKTYLAHPERIHKIRLLLIDTMLVLLVFLLSYVVRIVVLDDKSLFTFVDRVSWLVVVLGTGIHLLLFYVFGLYEAYHSRFRKMMFIKVALAVTMASIGVAFLSFIFPKYKMGRIIVAIHLIVLVDVIFLARVLCAKFRWGQINKKVLFIGWNKFVRRIAAALSSLSYGYVLEGLVVPTTINSGTNIGLPVMVHHSLEDALKIDGLETVVVTHDQRDILKYNNQLIDLKFQGLEVYDSPTFYEQLFGKVPVSEISAKWLLFKAQDEPFQPKIYLKLKRLLDVAFSLVVLLWTAPLFGIIALLIKLESKGPVFFKQERLGQFEKPFMLLKFRTMIDDAERECGPCWASENDPRFTRMGKFLRRTHLDEFPQFVNVLRGHMSLVGPRPIRSHFADVFTEKFSFYRLRFKAKPGITGWAQVNMDYVNTEHDQYEKLEYEFYYLFHQSIFLDLFIVLKTVQSVFMMRGG